MAKLHLRERTPYTTPVTACLQEKKNNIIIVWHHTGRLDICRDRHDRRSCKNISNCVNFSWKQRVPLQNLHINMKFTHLFGKFTHPYLESYWFCIFNHSYWYLRCFIGSKINPDLRNLVCKIFGTKIRSCKIFDKFPVWNRHGLVELIYFGEKSLLSVSICFVIKTLTIFHSSDNLKAHRFKAPISLEALRQGTSYSLLASLAIWRSNP